MENKLEQKLLQPLPAMLVLCNHTLAFYDVQSYDADFNGFIDSGEYHFFNLSADYDWDNDGFPDMVDTLPTVQGSFKNAYVRGVKDSDGDGLPDPGLLDFSSPRGSIAPEHYFGELPRIVGRYLDFDWCPYLPGNPENKGCPEAIDGDGFWYD